MNPTNVHDKINKKAKSTTDGRKSTNPSVHIPGILKALTLNQIPHRIINAQSEENSALTEWTERAFPFIHSQVDWSRIPSHQCVAWSELEDLVPKFELLVAPIGNESLVVVLWANALCPVLELEMAGVRRIAREIFEEHETSTDVLVFSQREGWLIEMYHEGTLCMGSGTVTKMNKFQTP